MVRPRLATNLVACFRCARILTVEELTDRLSVSRATAFRRLAEHGYYSSYNLGGRYLTLGEVARFNSEGLWCFKGACFSRYGGLRSTVEHMITQSTAGMTHEELAERLGVRVHNQLLDLVSEEAVSRERIGSAFVYLAIPREVRDAQVGIRTASGEIRLRPTSRQVIAVLLQLIGDPRAPRGQIVAGCQRGGVRITRETVDAIFAEYDLDKKRAP